MIDAEFVGKMIRSLATLRDKMSFNVWERIVCRWVACFNQHVPSFNEAEFLLAIGYEAELYRVQNGDAR